MELNPTVAPIPDTQQRIAPATFRPAMASEKFFNDTQSAIADAEKKAAAPPADPPVTEPITPPVAPAVPPVEPAATNDKWPRTAQDWKKFTEARDKALKERDDKIVEMTKAVDELTQRSKDATTSKEFEAIRKERDDLEQRLNMLSVTENPKFKNYFEGKRTEQLNMAKSVLGERFSQFETILKLPDGEFKEAQFEELTAELGTLGRSRLATIYNNIASIEGEKANEVSKWKEHHERMTVEQQAAQKTAETKRAEYQQGLTKEFESALTDALDKEKGVPAFQKRDKDDAWNTKVDQATEYARNLFLGKVDKKTAFQAIINAAAFAPVLEQSIAQSKEIERLNGVIKSMQGANPTLQGGREGAGAGTGSVEDDLKQGMRPQQASEAFAKRAARAMSGQ